MHTAQDNSTRAQPGHSQLQDIENLIHIVNLRGCLSTKLIPMEMFGTKSPVQLAEALQDYSVGYVASPKSTLLVVDTSIRLLESPAHTGFAFFVRLEASKWGLEALLSVFESAIFLSRWVLQLSQEERPDEGMHAALGLTYIGLIVFSKLQTLGTASKRGCHGVVVF